MAVINPPEKKLANRTSVHWVEESNWPYSAWHATYFDIRLSLVNATGNIDYFLSNIIKALQMFPTYFISDSLLMERMAQYIIN